MTTNKEFLETLFGEDSVWAHVTDFTYDPDHIPDNKHLASWCGDYFSRYQMSNNSNQYFTISTFYADDKGKARRRKALFRATHVIVLDDVREKLDIETVKRLPPPTWILETSPGSEQWGYKLIHPETDRHQVENLLDGLVANGLAPDGKDPGMKGVTRYVRLPEGYNLKAKKFIDGKPFKCRMLEWNPSQAVTLHQLADPFAVDLNAVRREGRVDGAAAVSDHPLLQIPDLVHIKEERSDGRFDITCPWVDEHTGAVDNGAGIFTNADGTIGFKCHHGACQHRTGRDLLEFLDQHATGFTAKLKAWQVQREFNLIQPSTPVAPASIGAPPMAPSLPPALPDTPVSSVPTTEPLAQAFNMLRQQIPYSAEAREFAGKMLRLVDDLPTIEKVYWHQQVRDVMRWTKPEMKMILDDLRQQWYAKANTQVSFFDEVVFVRSLNQFYDREKRIFYTPEAYQNSYAGLDAEARKQALQGNMVTKVDALDYAPLKPATFKEGRMVYGNTWSKSGLEGAPGDVSRYLEHFNVLGWAANRAHILKFFAWTILHPDQKINHMLLFGGHEGSGKDWILYPLVAAMGENHTTISGEELLSDFHDYALSCKHLNVNEAELGDRAEAKAVAAKIKPLAAAPPDYLRINQKGIKPVKVRNLLSVTMTTNSQLPFQLNGQSRRIYAVWSDLNVRDYYGNVLPEWREYWADRWRWMRGGGAEAVIHYLKTQVDLSDFSPGEAPPMTEYLREMQEASKPPLQLTIEALMERNFGCFQADIMSSADVVATLKAATIVHPDVVYAEPSQFNPTKVGVLMRKMPHVQSGKARDGWSNVNLWIIRNYAEYTKLTPTFLFHAYQNQMRYVKSQNPQVPQIRSVN